MFYAFFLNVTCKTPPVEKTRYADHGNAHPLIPSLDSSNILEISQFWQLIYIVNTDTKVNTVEVQEFHYVTSSFVGRNAHRDL